MAGIPVVAPVVDFASLSEKAKRIAERRSMLQAQEAAISGQLNDIQASLVRDYGQNYLGAFNEAVARIQQWDQAHSQVLA